MEQRSMSNLVTADYDTQANLDYSEITMTTPAFMHMEYEVNENKGKAYSRARLVLVWVLAFLIIVLNSIVIGILISSNKRRSRMSFFIFNLAIADLCVGLFDVVVDGFLEFTDGSWMLGDPLCKIHKFLKSVVLYASIYMLVMMSIDRALTVSKPLQSLNNGRRFRWMAIFISWGLSSILSIPSAVLYQTIDSLDNGGSQYCFVEFDDPKWWKVLLMTAFIFTFLIPVIMIVLSCATLICVLYRRKTDFGRQSRNGTNRSNRTDNQTNSMMFNSGISKSKFKSIRLSFGIVSGFIVCWGPYFIYNMLATFEVVKPHPIQGPILVLAYLNNVANPIMFFIYHHTLGTSRERAASLETTLSNSSMIRLQKLTQEKFCQDEHKPLQYQENISL